MAKAADRRVDRGVDCGVGVGAEDFCTSSLEQFEVGVVRRRRADVELQVVASGDVDQGEVAVPGAQGRRARGRSVLLGDPGRAAAVPFR
ncbi:hypothetical protein BN2537_16607 [Streptomyces venezuelae]|nr:hypothetical protein BN2537_16607 [Streptomyces venezuelae]